MEFLAESNKYFDLEHQVEGKFFQLEKFVIMKVSIELLPAG